MNVLLHFYIFRAINIIKTVFSNKVDFYNDIAK